MPRNCSICPPPELELLDLVKGGDTCLIEALVKSNRNLLKHEYPFPHEKSILGIICSSLDTTAYAKSGTTVKLLIDCGAELTGQHLHWAAANPNYEVLQVVVTEALSPKSSSDKSLLNCKIRGNTVLHRLIKSYKDNKCSYKLSEDKFVPHLELLLNSDIDVNEGDCKELSAIYWAASYKLAKFVTTILNKSIKPVDLDTHINDDGETARVLIMKHNLYPPEQLDKITVITDPLKLIIRYVKLSKEDDFIKMLEESPKSKDNDDGSATLLQYACMYRLIRGAKALLELKADVTKTAEEKRLPIELAAVEGHFEIFKHLLERHIKGQIDIPSSVLFALLKRQDRHKFGPIDHEKCTRLLLDQLKDRLKDQVNHKDDFNNTPLHYALRYCNQETCKKLLESGASLGASNTFGIMPIMDIKPKLLEEHLNSCIKFDTNNKHNDKRDFEVTLNYVNLLPPAPGTGFSPSSLEKQKLKGGPPTVEQRESQVIAYMSKDPELKHLLKHPIIVSFLFIKWHKIRWIFWTNLLLCLIFTTSLITYIFTYYGINCESACDEDITANTGICAILILTFILLIFRELFQMAVTGWKYYINLENIMELCLLVLTGCILCMDSNYDTRKQLSSIVILLAAFELVLMLGQHPKLSTNVVMLKTVSINFFTLLIWCSLLIIAFALSFNLLFKAPIVKSPTNKTDDVVKYPTNMFTDPGSSLFKTIVMVTGEIDSDSINFQTYPVTSKAIFTIFVFAITIILLNLLNGLAVSDIQNIKNEAEMVGHVARAQHINYVESMLLGNILPTKLLEICKTLFCCFPWSSRDYNLIPLTNRVCLFTSEMDRECKIVFFPNNKGKVKAKCNQIESNHCVAYFCDKYLDRETVNRVNAIIGEESQEDKEYCVDLQKIYQQQVELTKQVELLVKNQSINQSSEN